VTTATIDLNGAPSIKVTVGGAGSGVSGGFNGGGTGGVGGTNGSGGGGGGATDLKINGVTLLVAPGGGGGGGNGNGVTSGGTGGAGGAGSQNGTAGAGGTNNNAGEGDGGAAAQKPNGNGAAGASGRSGTFARTGGGGGGGGGGFAGGDGGDGGSRGSLSSGAGGGGGSGNAYVAPGATNVSYAGTGTGNGGVTISYLDITTTGLADGRATQPYSATLAAVGGTGPYTWTLNNPGVLPSGMSFDDATGVLSGTPATPADVTLGFTVADSSGLETNANLELDILPATAIVGDAPATNIGITTATGNGVMYPAGGSAQSITAAFCSISKSANMNAATTVAVTPAAPFGSATNVSCQFSGLTASTAYYYTVSATQPTTGTETSQSPQSFETEAKAIQTFNAPFPNAIKYKGMTKLLKKTKKSKTSAGKPVKVKLAKSSRGAYARGDLRFYKKITKKNGEVKVKTLVLVT